MHYETQTRSHICLRYISDTDTPRILEYTYPRSIVISYFNFKKYFSWIFIEYSTNTQKFFKDTYTYMYHRKKEG